MAVPRVPKRIPLGDGARQRCTALDEDTEDPALTPEQRFDESSVVPPEGSGNDFVAGGGS